MIPIVLFNKFGSKGNKATNTVRCPSEMKMWDISTNKQEIETVEFSLSRFFCMVLLFNATLTEDFLVYLRIEITV